MYVLRVAIITGASSGLGEQYAVMVDRFCDGIDEIWVIARREEKLKELE